MSSATTAMTATRTSDILLELDSVRKSGPLQHIVIPPCPDLLTRLRQVMAEAEPDLSEVARIASSDVAMSATLLRCANSPVYALGQPVQTIGQAMNLLGLEETAAIMTRFLAQGAIRVNHPALQRFWERSAKRAVAIALRNRWRRAQVADAEALVEGPYLRLWPHRHGSDGYFAAVWERI